MLDGEERGAEAGLVEIDRWMDMRILASIEEAKKWIMIRLRRRQRRDPAIHLELIQEGEDENRLRETGMKGTSQAGRL